MQLYHSFKGLALRANALLLLLLLPFLSVAQGSRQGVPASSDATVQRIIDGKYYWVYQVRPGDDLNSVARLFSLSDSKDIAQVNRLEMNASLVPGSRLFVPVPNSRRDARVSLPRVTVAGVQYWVHEVDRGETLYGLARRYNVDEGKLREANVNAQSGALPRGTRLRIPIPAAWQSSESWEWRRHVLARGETLYGVAKQYGVTVKRLLVWNPTLDTLYTRAGSTLLIGSGLASRKLGHGESLEDMAYWAGVVPDEVVALSGLASQPQAGRELRFAQPAPWASLWYTPRSGERLDELAKRLSTPDSLARFAASYAGALEANGTLKPGVAICLPVPHHGAQPTAERTHVAKAGESIYALCRQYGVSEASLRAKNPSLANGLRVGMTLVIPTSDFTPASRETARPAVATPAETKEHKVKSGESIYGLSRLYKISEAELRAANGGLREGLKVGQTLRIPVPVAVAPVSTPPPAGSRAHRVEAGESIYGLCRQYGISEADLRGANGGLAEGLKVGQVLVIPSPSSVATPPPVASTRIHRVQAGETLYSLARLYGVSEEALRAANGGLPNGLREGMDLVLPESSVAISSSPTNQCEPGPTLRAECEAREGIGTSRPLRIGLMLPLSLGTDEEGKPKGEEKFIDFYRGVLILLEQSKQSGVSVSLQVYDTRRSPQAVQRTVESGALRGLDALVGPVFKDELAVVMPYCQREGIPLISPLLAEEWRESLAGALIQCAPSMSTQLRVMVEQMQLPRTGRVLLLREGNPQEQVLGDNLHAMLSNRVARLDSSVRYHDIYIPAGSRPNVVQGKLREHLRSGDSCTILLGSNQETFITVVLGYLNTHRIIESAKLTVYGLPRWAKLERLDYGQLTDLRIRIFSPYYTDYSNPLVSSFVERFRNYFRTEPSQFALQGFDVGSYVIRALVKYGRDFPKCLSCFPVTLMQNRFKFCGEGGNGLLENQGLFEMVFDPENGYTMRSLAKPHEPFVKE